VTTNATAGEYRACEGDLVCQAISGDRVSNVPAGICAGPEWGTGTCICAKDHWCDDCSLHTIDLVSGLGFWSKMNEATGLSKPILRCNQYQRGGGDCMGSIADENMKEYEQWLESLVQQKWQISEIDQKWSFGFSSDSGTRPPTPPPKWLAATVAPADPPTLDYTLPKFDCNHGICDGRGLAAPSAGLLPFGLTPRPFCRCLHGWACHRCNRRTRDLQLRSVKCPCDAPSLSTPGGKFVLRMKNDGYRENLTVTLNERPYDTNDDCEIQYRFVPCNPRQKIKTNIACAPPVVPQALVDWISGNDVIFQMQGVWQLQARAIPRNDTSYGQNMEMGPLVYSGLFVIKDCASLRLSRLWMSVVILVSVVMHAWLP